MSALAICSAITRAAAPEVFAVWEPRRTATDAPSLHRGDLADGVVRGVLEPLAFHWAFKGVRDMEEGAGRYLPTRTFFRLLAKQEPCRPEESSLPPLPGALPRAWERVGEDPEDAGSFGDTSDPELELELALNELGRARPISASWISSWGTSFRLHGGRWSLVGEDEPPVPPSPEAPPPLRPPAMLPCSLR